MSDNPLWQALGQHWKWIALRGVAAVIFGVLAIAWPAIALTVLVLVWGAYAFVDGVFTLLAAARMRESGRPIWPLVLVGLLGVIAGLVAFFWPALTALGLLMLIAAWALVTGVLQIIAAIRLRKALANELWLGLSGALSVLFGVLMIANPGAGAVAVAWVIGAYAVFFGVMLVLLALRLRKTSTFNA
ncbi:HdeD family acid-resistance protein [Pseudomonas sp. 30_B]|uniref:HdeD family acid-resistance protein n=1 Tax=Pseudomonas sp. 30_B TaxID=2813575 RepID=UPI001A9E6DE6|nr:HdeD family acid-resistance protein [Pseudomonas sp. 30_B]